MLVMSDAEGFEGETVRLDKWKAEHIEEFLQTKLQPDDLVDM